jgi:hypothetical protein
MPAVSDALVERPMGWGVDTIFGLPGGGINGLMETLRKARHRIRYIHMRHPNARPGFARQPKTPSSWRMALAAGEQIAHGTRRPALHLSELLQMAYHEGPDGPAGAYPERRYGAAAEGLSRGTSLLLAGAAAVAASVIWYSNRRSE